MAIVHVKADIFTAPPERAILVHACNTVGSWGAGIALAFRTHFPDAFSIYKNHCQSHARDVLLGTCLIIPGEKYDIACLFTSKAYGKKKDTPEEILSATRKAVDDLIGQNTKGQALHACRFNSGKFGVPWDDSEAILRDLGVDITVYEPIEGQS